MNAFRNTLALLELIDDGDELEMPAGVARRLVAAGWQHPEGDSQARFAMVLADAVLSDSATAENVNALGAAALAAEGAFQSKM